MTQRGAASEAQLLTTQSSAGDVPTEGTTGQGKGPTKGAWGQQGLGKWDLIATSTARAGAATTARGLQGLKLIWAVASTQGSPQCPGMQRPWGQCQSWDTCCCWELPCKHICPGSWGEKSLLGRKCGLWWAELGWSGKRASAVQVLEQMKWRVLAWQTLAPPFASRPQGCSVAGR